MKWWIGTIIIAIVRRLLKLVYHPYDVDKALEELASI